jgi:hypothetical protein
LNARVATLEADFYIEVVEEALARHGEREIFNTDLGRSIQLNRVHQGSGEQGNQD